MLKYIYRTESDILNGVSTFDKCYDLNFECAVDYEKVDNPSSMPYAHHHDDYELYFLISGSRKYFLSTQIFTIQPNQIMLIKPNASHQVTINLNIPYERYVLYISTKMMSKLCKEFPSISQTPNTPFFSLPENAFKQTIKLLTSLQHETNIKDSHSSDIVKSLLAELLILIHRNADTTSSAASKKDIRLQNAIDYMIENFAEPLTLKKCAEIACMSRTHFSRVFHQTTASNFKEFLNQIRINKACELLAETNETVAQIALLVGFSSESYFGHIFRKTKKISPSKYRNQNKVNK